MLKCFKAKMGYTYFDIEKGHSFEAHLDVLFDLPTERASFEMWQYPHDVVAAGIAWAKYQLEGQKILWKDCREKITLAWVKVREYTINEPRADGFIETDRTWGELFFWQTDKAWYAGDWVDVDQFFALWKEKKIENCH